MNHINLTQVLKEASRTGSPVAMQVPVQLTSVTQDVTTGGKPYYTVEIADCGAKAKLRFWENSQAFRFLKNGPEDLSGMAVELSADFSSNQYGLDAAMPTLRLLTEEEAVALFAGDEEFQKRNVAEFIYIVQIASGIKLEPLNKMLDRAFEVYGQSFRNAAAAFGNHHARRGGLVEHTAQMLRCAVALAPLYPEATPDLLYAGVIFHDMGKIWETNYPARGFEALHSVEGELAGHIALGSFLVRELWDQVVEDRFADKTLLLHLTHLILSHHGQMEWGSPVEPKTPEAVLLHQIDMIDSRIEMFREIYRTGEVKEGGILEANRPLRGHVSLPFSALRDGKTEGGVAE